MFEKIKCFILDMDGTIYLGNELFPFTKDFLKKVEETGREYYFFTNNSSKSQRAYIEKLGKLGIPIKKDQMMISSHVIIKYLKDLKEQGYAEGDFAKTLKDLSYQWDIVTKIQKKDANGRFVTIDQRINEGKADEMDGSFKFTEDGTYRVVKDVYGYMSSMRNFLFEAKSNEVTIENKKEDKKEDKTTATTSTSQIATIKKKETQIAKPSRVVKL